MFILLVSRGIPTQRDPQWGCFEKDQAEALVSQGHKVVVVSVDGRFRCYYRKLGTTCVQINNIHYLNSYWCPFKLLQLCLGRRMAYQVQSWQLERLYQKVLKEHGQPDIIYSHYLEKTHIALLLKKKYNIPIVAMEHWSALLNTKLSSNIQDLGDNTYPYTDKIIAVSQALKLQLKQQFNVESTVIPNLLGGDFQYKPIETKNNIVQFVAVSNLIQSKGYDILIDAFAKANESHLSWTLTIVGDGTERTTIQQKIKQYGLQDKVHLLGRKTKQEIVTLLQNSHVFVLASRSETFGVAYIEALSMGVPIIATRCGGPEDFVQSTDGLLVPVDNLAALTDAIKYMIEHYADYDRAKIAADCKSRFAPEVIAKQLTHVFENVIATRHTQQ